MENSIHDIQTVLAKKRDWRNAERRKGDRRVKDGTAEQRKDTADVIRRARSIEIDTFKPSWWQRFCKMFLPVIILFIISTPSFAYTDTQIVNAIFMAEGGYHAQYSYGIRSVPYGNIKEARKICFRTIRHYHKLYQRGHQSRNKNFIQFVQRHYCPTTGHLSIAEIKLNHYWIKNVEYFLRHE